MSLWNFMYQNQIKNIVDLVSRTDGDAGYANLNAIARIFKVYLFSILTDVYGDIPYFAAGTAYFSKDYYPKYDKQQDIYNDFFNELDEAVKALSADGGSADGDLIFKGDYQKWRRFGNSLRLRLALRLVQADANTARTQAEAAINNVGGVMTSGDIAMFNSFSDIYDTGHGEYRRNALAQIWQSVDNSPSPFLCETLFNYMWYGRAESNDNINFEDGKKLGSNWKPEYAKSSKKDPRTFVISRLYYHDDPHAQKQPFKRIDLTDELYNKQVSGSGTTRYFVPVPKGRAWYDSWPWLMASSSTIKEAYNESVAVQGGSCHPQLNNAFLKTNTPGIAMTYAETCFLLAEAKVRWNIAAIAETPEDLYNTGVNEAIRFLENIRRKGAGHSPVGDRQLSGRQSADGRNGSGADQHAAVDPSPDQSVRSFRQLATLRIPQTHPAVQRLHPRREGREDAAPAELSDLRKPLQCGQLSGSHRTSRRQGRLDQTGMVGQKQYLLK